MFTGLYCPCLRLVLQHPHLAINEIDCRFKILIISISTMRKSNNLALFLAFAILISLVSGCTVCGNCTNCGPEVIADTYLDGINSLLQGKVQQLGYPLTIGRNKTSSSITYQIQYSSGLLISLRLNLDNMQIQLLSYSINGNLPTTSSSQTQTQSQKQTQAQTTTQVRQTYKSTSDGYFIVENYTNSAEVTQIMSYLSTSFKNTLSNFQLVGAEFTNKSQTIFRLKFKFLPTSSGLAELIQLVFVQYVSPNNVLLIDSNYSSVSFTGSFNTVDTKTILNDPWFSSINTLLIKKYSNLLGNYPQIVSLQEAQPYFKIVYQVADTNYSFIVLYDYFQNRILQGNLTSLKTVTTYTQAQYQTNNGNSNIPSSTSTVTNSVSGTSQSQGQASISTSSSSASSTSSMAITSSTSSTSSSGQKNVVNSVQSDSISSKPSNPSPPISVQPVLSVTATPVNSQTTASSSQSSQTTQTSQSAQTTLDIQNYKSNPEVISAVSFLNSLGQSFSINQVQSVQKLLTNGLVYFKITIIISSVGSITLNSQQVIFYQYLLQVNSGGSLSVTNTSYTNLNNPNFSLLTLDEVKKDQNIKNIARFLLSQQYPMLGSDSRVLAVYRDIPYYRIIFQGPSNIQLNYVIIYNFNGTVQVLSATSAQDQSQQSQVQTQTSIQSQNNQVQSQTAQAQSQTAQVQIQAQTQIQASTPIQTQSQTQPQSQHQPQPQSQTQPQPQPQQVQSQTQTQATVTSQSSQLPTATQSTPTQIINTGSTTSSTDTQAISSSQVTNTPTSITQTSSSQTLNIPAQSVQSASYQSYQQTQAVAFPQTQQIQNTQTTQNTQVSSTQSIDANSVQLQPVKPVTSQSAQSNTVKQTQTTTSSSSTTSSNAQSSQIKQNIEGFTHFGGSTDPLYTYVTQGMVKINQTLIAKGYNLGEINYKDIIYKLEGNLLTVLFKVQAGGLLFTYQYKGNIGSSYTLSNSLMPSPIQTSSDTTVTLPGAQSIIVKSINYELAPLSITSQPFIKYYLQFLDGSDICYSKQNLIGFYYNPQSQNQLLFRFKNATQYYNIATSTADIQRILTVYLGDRKQVLLQTQTAVDQKPSNIQSTSAPVQGSTTTVSISTNTPSGNSGLINTQSTSQTITSSGTNSQSVIQSNSQTQQQIVQQTSTASNQQTSQASQQPAVVIQPANNQQSAQSTQSVTTNTVNNPSVSVPAAQSTVSMTSQNVVNNQIVKDASSSQTASQIIIPQQSTQTTQSTGAASQTSQSTVTNSQIPQKSPSNGKPYSSSQNIIAANVDPHCLCYDLNKCIKCAHRFYLNNNQCVQVPNECLSYDVNTGVCLKCLPGFSLQNGLCELSSTVAYYFNNQCFECLGDYRLVNKKCIYAPNNDPASPSYPQIKNPLCMSWSNGNCQECLPGTYLSSRKICELIDPFCTVFDYATETCNSCQVGYIIRNGRCFTKQ